MVLIKGLTLGASTGISDGMKCPQNFVSNKSKTKNSRPTLVAHI